MVYKKPSNLRVRNGGNHQAFTEDAEGSVADRHNVPDDNLLYYKEEANHQENSSINTESDIFFVNSYIQEIAPENRILVDIGLDISTAILGFCVLDENGDKVNIGNIKLTSSKLEDSYDKANEVRNLLGRVVNTKTHQVRRIFVEEAAKKFTPGFSSATTLFSLAGFNQVVCQIFYDRFNVKPIKVGVRTARSKIGIKINTKDKSSTTKDKVLDIVMKLHPEFPWESHIAKTGKKVGQVVYGPQNFDMADAFVVARGGQLIYK